MTKPSDTLIQWVKALIFWLVCAHLLWWVVGISDGVIALSRIALNAVLPPLSELLSEISALEEGGWQLMTTVTPINMPDQRMQVPLDSHYLGRSVMWLPTVMALILATCGLNLRRLSQGMAASVIVFLFVLMIVVMGHLAAAISPEPSQFDDAMLPRPHGVPIGVEPLPKFLFHTLSFSFYLSVLIGPLVIPVVLWGVVCRRELARLIS